VSPERNHEEFIQDCPLHNVTGYSNPKPWTEGINQDDSEIIGG
jgi:hypothetical protein